MKKRKALLVALWIALGSALLVAASFLFTRSESGNQVLFGYSALKLGLFGVFLLLAAGAAILLWGVYRRRPWLEERLKRLLVFFQVPSRRQIFYFLIGLLAAVMLYLLWASGYYRPFQRLSPWIPVIHQQAGQALALAAGYAVLLAALMRVSFPPQSGQDLPDFKVHSFWGLLRLILVGTAIAAVLVFILVIFGLLLTRTSFSAISAFWFFENEVNDTPFRVWQLPLLLLVVIPLVIGIMKLKRYRLPLLLLLGLGLLLVFPLFLRSPISRVYYNLINHGSRDYTELACREISTVEIIDDFDHISTTEYQWLATKPPGYMVPFKWIAGAIRWLAPGKTATHEGCTAALQMVMVYLGPLLSLLSLIPVYYISGQFLKEKNRYLPVLAALLMPNFLLMSGFADQYLLPLVFILPLWLGMTAVRRRSYWLAFLTGLAICLALFISFSLVPLVILIVGWLGLEALRQRSWKAVGQAVLMGLAILLGIVLLGLLMYWLWGYDPIARWEFSLQIHRTLVRIKDPVAQLRENIRINILEYGVFVGPPALLLFLQGLWQRWRKLPPPPPAGRKPAFLVLVVGLFAALLLSGQNRAEVARLWIYLNPLVAMAAVVWLDDLEKRQQITLAAVYTGLQLSLAYFYNFAFFGIYL